MQVDWELLRAAANDVAAKAYAPYSGYAVGAAGLLAHNADITYTGGNVTPVKSQVQPQAAPPAQAPVNVTASTTTVTTTKPTKATVAGNAARSAASRRRTLWRDP